MFRNRLHILFQGLNSLADENFSCHWEKSEISGKKEYVVVGDALLCLSDWERDRIVPTSIGPQKQAWHDAHCHFLFFCARDLALTLTSKVSKTDK